MKVDKIVQEQLTTFANQCRQAVGGHIGVVIVVGESVDNKHQSAMGISGPGWSTRDQFEVMIAIASTANALLQTMSKGHCEIMIKTPGGPLPIGKTQQYREVVLGEI